MPALSGILQSFQCFRQRRQRVFEMFLLQFQMGFCPSQNIFFASSIIVFLTPVLGQDTEFVSTCFHSLLFPLAPACNNSPIWVLFFVAHNQSISCTRIRTSPCLSNLLTISCPPTCHFLHLPKFFAMYFGPVYSPCIIMYLLPLPHLTHPYLLDTARHSIRCFVPSLFFS